MRDVKPLFYFISECKCGSNGYKIKIECEARVLSWDMHEYSLNSIFPKIYFTEIHATVLLITLIFVFAIHHVISC